MIYLKNIYCCIIPKGENLETFWISIKWTLNRFWSIYTMDYCEAINKNDLTILIQTDIHRKLSCEKNRLHKTIQGEPNFQESKSHLLAFTWERCEKITKQVIIPVYLRGARGGNGNAGIMRKMFNFLPSFFILFHLLQRTYVNSLFLEVEFNERFLKLNVRHAFLSLWNDKIRSPSK